MEEFLLNPFYLEDDHIQAHISGGTICMEEFFLKLGLMTQKNHNELMQTVDGLRVNIESLTTEIAKLNSQVTKSHMDLSDKIDALVDATKNLSAHITENFLKVENAQVNLDKKFSYLKEEMTSNQSVLEERFATMANQTTAVNSAVKESLDNVEELLRLTAANQIMNLVEK